MKKTILMAVVALMGCTALNAQERERMSDEERAKVMGERIEKSAEHAAKEFGLKDDAKKTFIATFTEYQKEMFATNRSRDQRSEQAERDGEKKLTDEEMATIATLERNNRLVKGQVFLWPGANDWHDLWDEDGVIVDCTDC